MIRPVEMTLLALCATVVMAAPVPKQLKKDEQAAIVGDWVEPAEKKRSWWFKEDGTAGGGDNPTQRKGTYKIDPTTTPKSIDWSDDGGKTWQLGVYSIEDGVLTVNIGREAKDARPTSFDENARTYKITATRKKD